MLRIPGSAHSSSSTSAIIGICRNPVRLADRLSALYGCRHYHRSYNPLTAPNVPLQRKSIIRRRHYIVAGGYSRSAAPVPAAFLPGAQGRTKGASGRYHSGGRHERDQPNERSASEVASEVALQGPLELGAAASKARISQRRQRHRPVGRKGKLSRVTGPSGSANHPCCICSPARRADRGDSGDMRPADLENWRNHGPRRIRMTRCGSCSSFTSCCRNRNSNSPAECDAAMRRPPAR